MKKIAIILLFVLSLFSNLTAHSQMLKTATVDRLLQREYIGAVLIDNERGVAYFERVDAIDSSPVRFPYPTTRMYNSALKKIYLAPLDGGIEAEPLFEQEDNTGYYFASDNPWSPNRRYFAIYKFREGHVQPGVVDVKERTAKFFDVSAYYSLKSSLDWVSNHEFAIARAEDTANTQTYRVNGVLAIDEARKKGWRDGAVTADVVGAGKYERQKDTEPGVGLVKIDVRSGKTQLVEHYQGLEDNVLDLCANTALEFDDVDTVGISGTEVFYLRGGELWRAGLGDAPENLTEAYPYDIKIHQMSDVWRDAPLALIKSVDNECTLSLEKTVFFVEVEGQKQYLMFSTDGSHNTISPPNENSYLLAANKEGAVFLTNSYEQGSLLQYVKAGDTEEPFALYRFNRQLAGVTPAVGPISVRHHGFDGRAVTSWLFLPPGASLERPIPYPMVMIPYSELVYSTESPKSSYAQGIWQLESTIAAAAEVFAAQGYAVLLPSIPLVERGQVGEPMTHMMPAILSGLDAAVETGYVDPERVAVSGHSFGGYTALSIAVQSDRFKAVIAHSPLANLISSYGQFSPYLEVNAYQFENLGPWFLAVSQGRMVVSPWRNADRYVRNSPLFFAHQTVTPILLIHGDYDGAAVVEQSEEIFTALKQEGKDVIFVRYFGEHHKNLQPQNQRDMWQRIFVFLKENGV